MARVVKSLLSSWAAYSMPPAVEQEEAAVREELRSDVGGVLAHLKYERDRLEKETAVLSRKLDRAHSTIVELTNRVKLCCSPATTERVLTGIDIDRTEESNLALIIEEAMSEAVSTHQQSEDSSVDTGEVSGVRRKYSGIESRLDAIIRKSEKTLERLMEKMKSERDVFVPAIRQIRTQLEKEIPICNEKTLIDSLVTKLEILAAMETLKQSALRYDLLSLEQIFSMVIDTLAETEFSILAMIHVQKVPIELVEKLEALATRRIDLSFDQPSIEGITKLLGLIPHYEALFRNITKEDFQDSLSVCDVIGVAHRVGQLASDSQRTLSELAQSDMLEHRIHLIQTSLLAAKASLVATEEGTMDYVNRLFQIIREQETIKVEILKRSQDEVQDEEEKHAKTATELQSLAMEYLAIVSQLASFSRKPTSRFIDMVPYLPENEQEIVRFSEEARRKCAEVLEEASPESSSQGDFLLDLLSECEQCLLQVPESENTLALCRSLKRHILEGRLIGETETKRVVPWSQTKEVLATTLQTLMSRGGKTGPPPAKPKK